MMEHSLELIKGALRQAGEPTPVTPELLALEEHRITCDKKLKPMDFLFRLFGKPCFPRRELVAITGKAKSGKTFLTSMLMVCCIVCILHQNKGSEDHNLRGWIGTELMNKAFEVYACEKLLPDRIFEVTQTMTRKYDIPDSLYFRVNQDGLPVACQGAQATANSTGQEQLPALKREYIVYDDDGKWSFNIRRLFNDALQGESEVTGSVLRDRVMMLSGIAVPFKYNQVLSQALSEKVIERYEKNRLTYYRAAPF